MKKKTVFALIIDKSGSMFDIKDEIFQSINDRIKSIKKSAKKEDKKMLVELVSFNHHITRLRTFESALTIKKLKEREYEVGGTTSLYDALGSTLERIELMFGKEIRQETCNVMVVVYTDGYENSSRQFSNEDIKEMLSKANETKGFEVAMVGCDEETLTMARRLNFRPKNIVRTSKEEMNESMESVDDYLVNFSMGRDVNFKKSLSKFDLDKK